MSALAGIVFHSDKGESYDLTNIPEFAVVKLAKKIASEDNSGTLSIGICLDAVMRSEVLPETITEFIKLTSCSIEVSAYLTEQS